MDENEQKEVVTSGAEQKGNFGWAVLGFFIPLAGFILWLVWKESKPADSKMAGIGCLVGIITSVVLSVASFGLSFCIALAASASEYSALIGL